MSMDRRQREALDRHITGNYGEDQFKGELGMSMCDRCEELFDAEAITVTPMGWVCPGCREIYLSEQESAAAEGPQQLEFDFGGDPLDDPRRGQAAGLNRSGKL